jgi:hypothetical protein
MISVEKCTEGQKIIIVSCREAHTSIDMETQGNQTEKWVRNLVGLIPTFNP